MHHTAYHLLIVGGLASGLYKYMCDTGMMPIGTYRMFSGYNEDKRQSFFSPEGWKNFTFGRDTFFPAYKSEPSWKKWVDDK